MASTLAALALIPLAAASPYTFQVRQALPDNYQIIEGNITQTVQDIIATNSTVTSFPLNGTDVGYGLIQLLGDSQNIQRDLNNTINDLQGSSVLTSSESQNIYVALSGLLGPTFDLLNNFVAHCNTFQNINGAKSAVVQQLQAQSTTISAEGAALQTKLAAPYPQSIGFGIGLIQSRFDSALDILTRSSCPPPGSTAFPGSSGSSCPTATGGAGTTVTVTASATPAPASTITVTASGTAAPASTVTVTGPGSTVTAPAATVTVTGAGSTITAPASTVTVTGTGKTVTVSGAAPPASTVTVSGAAPPASTVTVSGAAPPASTVTVSGAAPPASTITVTKTESGSPAAPTTVTVTAAPPPASTVTVTKTESGSPAAPTTVTVTKGTTITQTAPGAPGTTVVKTTTVTAPASTTTEAPCYFWEPCFQSKLSKLHASPTPYQPQPYYA